MAQASPPLTRLTMAMSCSLNTPRPSMKAISPIFRPLYQQTVVALQTVSHSISLLMPLLMHGTSIEAAARHGGIAAVPLRNQQSQNAFCSPALMARSLCVRLACRWSPPRNSTTRMATALNASNAPISSQRTDW